MVSQKNNSSPVQKAKIKAIALDPLAIKRTDDFKKRLRKKLNDDLQFAISTFNIDDFEDIPLIGLALTTVVEGQKINKENGYPTYDQEISSMIKLLESKKATLKKSKNTNNQEKGE